MIMVKNVVYFPSNMSFDMLKRSLLTFDHQYIGGPTLIFSQGMCFPTMETSIKFGTKVEKLPQIHYQADTTGLRLVLLQVVSI